jgi:outer membrane protein assembly factor BamB
MPSTTRTRREVLAAAGATSLLSLTGCIGRVVAENERIYERDAPVGAVTGAWPTYQHDFAQTGATSEPGPSSSATVEGVAAGNADMASSVALADGYGFVGYSNGDGDGGAYRGFETGDSNASWTVEYHPGKSTPTLAGDTMFVSTAEFLAAYDARNGKLCWRMGASGYGKSSNSPAIAADTLLDDNGETVFGYDPSTGKKRWRYDAGGSGSALVARDGVAYTTISTNHESTGVAAIDPTTGEEHWRRDDLPKSVVPLVAGSDYLYYAAHRGDIYALSVDDGTTQWTASIPLPEDGSARLATADGVLHAHSADGNLAALDATDGSAIWRRTLDTERDLGARPPIVADDTRFVLCDKRLYALDAASGKTDWSLVLPARPALKTAPSIRGDTLYYAGPGRGHGVFRVAD